MSSTGRFSQVVQFRADFPTRGIVRLYRPAECGGWSLTRKAPSTMRRMGSGVSIYRISLAIRMKETFPLHPNTPPSLMNRRQITASSSMTIRWEHSSSADQLQPFFNIIYSFTNVHIIDECRRMIDAYARNEGTTWGETIPTCNLNKIDPPTCIDRPVIVDASDHRAQRLRELTDALGVVAPELNKDVKRTASSIGTFWT